MCIFSSVFHICFWKLQSAMNILSPSLSSFVNIGVCEWVDPATHVFLFECHLVLTSTFVGIEIILMKVIAHIFSLTCIFKSITLNSNKILHCTTILDTLFKQSQKLKAERPLPSQLSSPRNIANASR